MKTLKFVSPEFFLPEKVAIVGSSGTLSKSKLGETIDDFECVIRFNRAPTKDFKEQVGSKTTLRVVNNHVFDNKPIKGFSNQPKDFIKNLKGGSLLFFAPDMTPWNRRANNVDEKRVKLYRFHYEKMRQMKNQFGYKGSNFSVGTGTILLCVLSGVKPTLFGIDLTDRNRDHYWETRPLKPGGCHSVSKEKKLLQKLLDEEKISVVE